MFEKIKKWYFQKLWSEDMVRNALEKGVITKEQYAEIISQQDVFLHVLFFLKFEIFCNLLYNINRE